MCFCWVRNGQSFFGVCPSNGETAQLSSSLVATIIGFQGIAIDAYITWGIAIEGAGGSKATTPNLPKN